MVLSVGGRDGVRFIFRSISAPSSERHLLSEVAPTLSLKTPSHGVFVCGVRDFAFKRGPRNALRFGERRSRHVRSRHTNRICLPNTASDDDGTVAFNSRRLPLCLSILKGLEHLYDVPIPLNGGDGVCYTHSLGVYLVLGAPSQRQKRDQRSPSKQSAGLF